MKKSNRTSTEALRRIETARIEGSYSLNLSGVTLNEIPSEIGELKELRVLNLGERSEFDGTGSWWNHELDSNCEHNFDDLTPIQSLTQLVALSIAGCSRITELRPLLHLENLKQLDLEYCRSLRDISALAQLKQLRALVLNPGWEDTCLDDFGALEPLTELRILHLSGCEKLYEIDVLSNMTRLQELELSGQICDLNALRDMRELRSLNSYCDRLGDIGALAGLKALRRLNLRGSNVRDLAPIGHLSSLEELELSDCSAVVSWAPVSNLKKLRSLNLSQNSRLTDLRALAGLSNLRELDLSYCKSLSDLNPLTVLTRLEELNLSDCEQLRDGSPLGRMPSLSTLDFSDCKNLTNFTFLKTLQNLRELRLDNCRGSFAPIRDLLDGMKELSIRECQFDDLPQELISKDWNDNAVERIRAHFADLQDGAVVDAELKLFVLGNGGVGKTQLSRRLRGEPFDPSIPSTHGIHLGEFKIAPKAGEPEIQLCCWDFGGQDIYHGTHALFLQRHGIFLILWAPSHETGETKVGALTVKNRPLAYWLDYVRGLAGLKSPILIVQGQCDDGPPPAPRESPTDFEHLENLFVSSQTGRGPSELKKSLGRAVSKLMKDRPLQKIGAGRVKVRERIRELQKAGVRTLEIEKFRELCAEVGKVHNPDALLDYLHTSGVVFFKSGLFKNSIVLDQTWAIEAIYSFFDRQKTAPLLRDGRFSLGQLSSIVWPNLSAAEQKVVLEMMRSCGICFPADTRANGLEESQHEFIVPDLLPEWSQARASIIDRLRAGAADEEANVKYRFLHDGILRSFLAKIGDQAGDDAVYWKYGCWFCEAKSQSVILVQAKTGYSAEAPGRGEIQLQAWGKTASSLLDSLVRMLLEVPASETPEVERKARERGRKRVGGRRREERNLAGAPVERMAIVPRSRLPDDGSRRVFLSYAWGDGSETGQEREIFVESLCKRLAEWDYEVIRDKNSIRTGDLISTFMKTMAAADRVIILLSEKYLRSFYCMTELHEIYRTSRAEKDQFLSRLIPIKSSDTAIETIKDRTKHARFWKEEYESLRDDVSGGLLGPTDLGQWARIGRWVLDVNEMLASINDQLLPTGFEAIAKSNFSEVRDLLDRNKP